MLGALRRIACCLSVLMLSAGVVGTASAEPAVSAAAHATFIGPGVELSTRGEVSAAAISCGVSVGNDVTLYDRFLNVTWAIACRDTATGQLTPLAKDITMIVAIRKGTTIIQPISPPCVTAGPTATCFHRVPYDGFSGKVDSIMAAQVTWTDGVDPLIGSFRSPGKIIT